MNDPTLQADKASNARARILPFFGFALLAVQQWLFFGREWEDVAVWQLGLWLVIAVVALLVLVTGGGWFQPREVRALLNDEVSSANRQRAIAAAFVTTIVTAMLVFAISPFEPLSAQRAAHLICSLGLGVGLFGFGLAEMISSNE